MKWLQFDNKHCSHISLPLPEEGKEEIYFKKPNKEDRKENIKTKCQKRKKKTNLILGTRSVPSPDQLKSWV